MNYETTYTANAIYEEILGQGLDREPDFSAEQYAREYLAELDPPEQDPETVVRLVVEQLR